MKTTVELPDALVRKVKLRALRENKKLKDMLAELLERGLQAREDTLKPAIIGTDPTSGLPILLGGHPAPEGEELTPERIHEVLLDQEIGWHAISR